MIIAIDGPAASGTLAKRLAARKTVFICERVLN